MAEVHRMGEPVDVGEHVALEPGKHLAQRPALARHRLGKPPGEHGRIGGGGDGPVPLARGAEVSRDQLRKGGASRCTGIAFELGEQCRERRIRRDRTCSRPPTWQRGMAPA